MSTPQVEQGEIYLIQWNPSVGHEFRKMRPGIVLSSNQTLQKSNLITCVALTGNSQNCLPDDILISKNKENNLEEKSSVIKVHHISSFDRQRFIKYIGKISPAVLQEIKKYLRKHFDI